MNSLVRMLQYIQQNPQEKSWKEPLPEKGIQNWPTEGKIEAKDITYQYRENLPQVIKQISFQINPKEKIGIVGRTGSGKSTLTLGLLRILELWPDSKGNLGQIFIDGQDISKIGLHILREKCTIIPQDPVLFTGNLKFNLDPFNKYTKQECIEALKQVQILEQIREIYQKTQEKERLRKSQLQQKQQQQPQQNLQKNKYMAKNNNQDQQVKQEEQIQVINDEILLDTPVDDGGDNFSMGQRQLICMARALIRKPKVLLMDEATASIDEKTDQMIQKMIKHVFKETTVVTIAHRINTIVQYDRLILLENGKIVEIDTPYNLMEKNTGLFASLVNEGGDAFRQKMMYLAANKNVELDEI